MLVHEGAARTAAVDRRLALSLAAVAGALNTAGFDAAGLYASNMTGNVSAISDHAGLGEVALAAWAALVVALFTAGAGAATLLIRHRRLRGLPGAYASGIGAEALVLAATGSAALLLPDPARAHALVVGLSFALGLQNAVATKITGARVRTTHVTGLITDIGIELARRFDGGAGRDGRAALAPHDAGRLTLHLLTIAAFLGGGLVGLMAYRWTGAALLFAVAAMLGALAAPAFRR